MSQKTYRIHRDIRAKSEDDAYDKLGQEAEENGILVPALISSMFRIQEDPLTDEEEGIILELARIALVDTVIYEEIADTLDLSDKVLKALQKRLKKLQINLDKLH